MSHTRKSRVTSRRRDERMHIEPLNQVKISSGSQDVHRGVTIRGCGYGIDARITEEHLHDHGIITFAGVVHAAVAKGVSRIHVEIGVPQHDVNDERRCEGYGLQKNTLLQNPHVRRRSVLQHQVRSVPVAFRHEYPQRAREIHDVVYRRALFQEIF